MQVSIKKQLDFEYAHRLYQYDGKCCNIHGHNQQVWVYFRSMNKEYPLDSLGMVIDFNAIKKGIGQWIDDNWDHGTLYHKDDEEIKGMFQNKSFKTYEMPYNPTAENMAIYLLGTIAPSLYKDTGVEMYKIEVFENNKSVAIAEL
jgi:6-pyruvoyltetrahydropterin/6-carboxytetrahydropterin synthase